MPQSFNPNNPPKVNEIESTLKQAKTSVKHFQCTDERKFATLWKGGSDFIIGTDGGLKDGIGTSGITMEMIDVLEFQVNTFGAETCKLGSLHSTREEIRAMLGAEEIIDKCGELWGRNQFRKSTCICDSKNAIVEFEKPNDVYKHQNALGP